MPSRSQRLEKTLDDGFPLGEDIPRLLGDDARIERLRETLGELATEDLVVEMVGDEGFRRERHGLHGFLEAWRDWVEPFETFRVELDELIEAGPHVVVLVHQTGRPRGTATEIEHEGAAVWTFDGDLVVRVEFHLNRRTALRAAGIETDQRRQE